MTTASFTQRAASFTALASIFAAAVLMASGPAQAQSDTRSQTKDPAQTQVVASPSANDSASRPLTRAEVRTEFIRARAAGELPVDGFSGYFFEQPQAKQIRLTAQEVRASK
jgi:hypothetical protein